MKNTNTPKAADPGKAANKPDKDALDAYIESRETDENLEKLSRNLAADWDEDAADNQPDLSFEKFKKKLEDTENQ